MKFRDLLTRLLTAIRLSWHVEQMEFSENVVSYQTTLQFLNNRISGLMSAIKGE